MTPFHYPPARISGQMDDFQAVPVRVRETQSIQVVIQTLKL